MRLNNKAIQNKFFWEAGGYILPGFDRIAAIKRTVNAPVWVHFGAGNIFRAYIAVLQQRLMDEGLQDKGIIAAEGYDYEIIDSVYVPFDNLSISVTLVPDGNVKKRIVGSIMETVKANSTGMKRLYEIFSMKCLQMISFTITEKGYDLIRSDGTLQPEISDDYTAGPGTPKSFLGKLVSLCYHRYSCGAYPLALVSMDNCSKNGILLRNAVRSFAKKWVADGYIQPGFLDYIDDPGMLSFPCTMIDKITPYPDAGVAKILADDGVEDMVSFVTAKKSETAPFVNSEEPEYLVIEDVFPNGRPPLEKAGVIFTDRETVDKAETMKVCTCLNPLHTAMSVFACILSYTRVSEAMKDPDIRALVQGVADEGLPVVTDPVVISPREFIETVLNVRLPNPYIPDTPQRIATDTSRKLAVRFGETIKAYVRNERLDINELRAIPLSIAGWCRYLMGVNDNGELFTPDPDPLLGELKHYVQDITLGSSANCSKALAPILSNTEIFGINLFDAGIADKVIRYFEMMVKGTGAVRNTLSVLCKEDIA